MPPADTIGVEQRADIGVPIVDAGVITDATPTDSADDDAVASLCGVTGVLMTNADASLTTDEDTAACVLDDDDDEDEDEDDWCDDGRCGLAANLRQCSRR
jgi:hypothetical protein